MKRAMERNPSCFKGTAGQARLENLASGWVGPTVAANFATFFAQYGSGITPDAILLAKKWKDVEPMVKDLATTMVDTIRFGESMVNWIMENEDKMHEGRKVTDFGKLVGKNLNSFMRTIEPEEAVQIATTQFDKYRKSKATGWVGIVCCASPELTDYLTELADMDI